MIVTAIRLGLSTLREIAVAIGVDKLAGADTMTCCNSE